MNILKLLESDTVVLLLVLLLFVLLGLVIYLMIKTSKINKKYETFIKKIGNGKNIEQDLKKYMERVEKVTKQNSEIARACDILDENLKVCIQKTGIVRYNAFKDTGSELSFALALLDRKNNGVVLNGIYSRDTSNIYAKPVENGKATYKASQEEEEAIAIAVKNEKQ